VMRSAAYNLARQHLACSGSFPAASPTVTCAPAWPPSPRLHRRLAEIAKVSLSAPDYGIAYCVRGDVLWMVAIAVTSG
jgi:hypothetical protein